MLIWNFEIFFKLLLVSECGLGSENSFLLQKSLNDFGTHLKYNFECFCEWGDRILDALRTPFEFCVRKEFGRN